MPSQGNELSPMSSDFDDCFHSLTTLPRNPLEYINNLIGQLHDAEKVVTQGHSIIHDYEGCQYFDYRGKHARAVHQLKGKVHKWVGHYLDAKMALAQTQFVISPHVGPSAVEVVHASTNIHPTSS
ncbi:hypothetical protein TIFTF001_038910 [Ficus carica]|uniref:Uncharacterized protein n=1 Tax=Ficus carica TaxID=3494 RepID=A0AA88E845_FICCA|nr:hypothetical protein TIFTF001_038910 [Ficus carica]